MGRRPTAAETREGRRRARKGTVGRLVGAAAALSVLTLLAPTQAATQQLSMGAAFVTVPSVSQLDITSVTSSRTGETGNQVEGVFRVQVRANHAWSVVVTSTTDAVVWVRGEAGTWRQLRPGGEAVVASGTRGERHVDVEYRIEGADAGVGLPLTYTLADASS